MLKYLILISSITVAMMAALFSITGIASLFSAKFFAVVVMAAALEMGKLVMASYLYRWWKKTPILLRVYSIISVVILMGITSIGIYGYLSVAHGAVAAPLDVVRGEIYSIESQQQSLMDQITNLGAQNDGMERRKEQNLVRRDSPSDELDARSLWLSIQQENADLDVRVANNGNLITDARSERARLDSVKVVLNAELSQSDFGPYIYIADTLNISIGVVVHWFVLFIVLVFDPLAISLILAYNNIVVKEMEARGEEIDETKGFSPFGKTENTPSSTKMTPPEPWPEPPEEAEPLVQMEPNKQPDWIEEPPVVQSVARLVPRELSPPEPTPPELEVVEEEDVELDAHPEEFVITAPELPPPLMDAEAFGEIVEAEEELPEVVEVEEVDDESISPTPHGPISTTNEFPA